MVILQNIYDYVEDFLDSDEWMEDDLMLTSASSHDGLKSPPPYSLQSTLTDFGHTFIIHLFHMRHLLIYYSCTEHTQLVLTKHCKLRTYNFAVNNKAMGTSHTPALAPPERRTRLVLAPAVIYYRMQPIPRNGVSARHNIAAVMLL